MKNQFVTKFFKKAKNHELLHFLFMHSFILAFSHPSNILGVAGLPGITNTQVLSQQDIDRVIQVKENTISDLDSAVEVVSVINNRKVVTGNGIFFINKEFVDTS